MNFEFSDKQQQVYETVGFLAREHFAARVAQQDRNATLPLDNLRDLHEEGLLGLTISKDLGGLDSGVMGHDPLLYLLALEQTARVSLPTAHCLHIHLHIAHLIDQEGSRDQRESCLRPVIERGALLSGIGSEPGRAARGIYSLETTATHIKGGYVIRGRKNYATLADVAEFNIVFASIADQSPAGGHLAVIIPRGAKGLRVVPDSWNPMGMRSAVSPSIVIEDCFVPEQKVVGEPGMYPRARWQARHYLALAAQYLGGCEGIFDTLTDYLPQRGITRDVSTQLRLGEIRILIDSARWLLYRAAWLWTKGDLQHAEIFSLEAKHQAMRTCVDVMDKSAQIAGSSAFLADMPMSRSFRDLRIHTLHSSFDKMAITIGRYHLGETFDTTDRL